ncbi:MAG: winged helix-turn-helix domain-containing protein [Candidatus Thermoplasmatota archaeon]|nr:winged helix-turn-helix domain-containing protein [Candidatus Thermoplasmatota archaeon]
MTTVIEQFGLNAGKVWQVLNEKGPLSETKLVNTTLLNEQQLRTAIGWLARENKICRNKTVYKIGDTNLVEKVGADAGKVWTALQKKQTEVDISSLARLTKIEVRDVYTALGWLAREDKIVAKSVKKQKKQQLKVCLK